jgi:hypothetical protein
MSVVWDNMSKTKISNKMLTPYFCNPRRRSVLEPVMRTPTHTGMLNKRLKAKAVPITEKC